jgi:Fe-S-cluster containining protein
MSFKQLVTSEYCLKCRGCCRFRKADSVWSPGLTDEDIQMIQGQVRSDSWLVPEKRMRLIRDPSGDGFLCPFLRIDDHACGIYPVRPLECRLYPFVINRREHTVFLAVDTNCPFAEERMRASGAGPAREWNEYITFLENLLSSEPYCGLLRRNPQIIQTYKDVLDLRELFR